MNPGSTLKLQPQARDTSQNQLVRPLYRPDIDGLRGIAVMLVVLFHAFPTYLKGGFVGVDIFFVISGFLISLIIFSNLEKGTFKFKGFYARRIKRLFPALIPVLLVTLAFGWVSLLAEEYKQLGKHVLAGACFFSNFVLWKEVGYFDVAADTKPLLHLWSLGIEEQFYIIWPFLIWFVWRRNYSLFATILTISIISFFLNVLQIQYFHNAASFYLPYTRFWELSGGSLLAYALLKKEILVEKECWLKKFGRINSYPSQISIFGIAILCLSVLLIKKSNQFPGWWAVLPVLGTSMTIAGGKDAWLNRHILSNKVLVTIGLISFPLYLWHWPILSFARIVNGGELSSLIRIAIVAVSTGLAWLTYKYIENPIRLNNQNRRALASLTTLMVGMGCMGYLCYKNDGFALRYPEFIQKIADSSYEKTIEAMREHKCFLAPDEDVSKFSADCTDSSKSNLVFLWGDSNAAALYTGLKQLGNELNFGVAQYTASACPPFLDYEDPTRPYCKEINSYVLSRAIELRPTTIILHAHWLSYPTIGKIELTLKKLKKAGIKNILLVGPVPQWTQPLPKILVNHWKKGPIHQSPPVYIRSDLDDSALLVDKEFQEKIKELDIIYFSAYHYMCNTQGCITRVGADGTQIVSPDTNHLTPAGSIYLSAGLKSHLKTLYNIN